MVSDLIYHLREDGEVKVPWEDEHLNAVSLTMPGELSNLFGDGATLSGGHGLRSDQFAIQRRAETFVKHHLFGMRKWAFPFSPSHSLAIFFHSLI